MANGVLATSQPLGREGVEFAWVSIISLLMSTIRGLNRELQRTFSCMLWANANGLVELYANQADREQAQVVFDTWRRAQNSTAESPPTLSQIHTNTSDYAGVAQIDKRQHRAEHGQKPGPERGIAPSSTSTGPSSTASFHLPRHTVSQPTVAPPDPAPYESAPSQLDNIPSPAREHPGTSQKATPRTSNRIRQAKQPPIFAPSTRTAQPPDSYLVQLQREDEGDDGDEEGKEGSEESLLHKETGGVEEIGEAVKEAEKQSKASPSNNGGSLMQGADEDPATRTTVVPAIEATSSLHTATKSPSHKPRTTRKGALIAKPTHPVSKDGNRVDAENFKADMIAALSGVGYADAKIDETATKIVNWVCHTLLGEKAVSRVCTVATVHVLSNEAAAARTDQNHLNSAPDAWKDAFNDLRKIKDLNSPCQYRNAKHFVKYHKAWQYYKTLKTARKGHSEAVLTYLDQELKRLEPAKSHGPENPNKPNQPEDKLSARVAQVMALQLQMTENQFEFFISKVHAAHNLIEHYTAGIATLFHPMSRLHLIASVVKNTNRIFRAMDRHYPQLKTFCHAMNKRLMKPIISGTPFNQAFQVPRAEHLMDFVDQFTGWEQPVAPKKVDELAAAREAEAQSGWELTSHQAEAHFEALLRDAELARQSRHGAQPVSNRSKRPAIHSPMGSQQPRSSQASAVVGSVGRKKRTESPMSSQNAERPAKTVRSGTPSIAVSSQSSVRTPTASVSSLVPEKVATGRRAAPPTQPSSRVPALRSVLKKTKTPASEVQQPTISASGSDSEDDLDIEPPQRPPLPLPSGSRESAEGRKPGHTAKRQRLSPAEYDGDHRRDRLSSENFPSPSPAVEKAASIRQEGQIVASPEENVAPEPRHIASDSSQPTAPSTPSTAQRYAQPIAPPSMVDNQCGTRKAVATTAKSKTIECQGSTGLQTQRCSPASPVQPSLPAATSSFVNSLPATPPSGQPQAPFSSSASHGAMESHTDQNSVVPSSPGRHSTSSFSATPSSATMSSAPSTSLRRKRSFDGITSTPTSGQPDFPASSQAISPTRTTT